MSEAEKLKTCEEICATCPSFQKKDRTLACEGMRATDSCLLWKNLEKLEAENKRLVGLLVEVLNQACEYEKMMEAENKKLNKICNQMSDEIVRAAREIKKLRLELKEAKKVVKKVRDALGKHHNKNNDL